MAELSRDVDVHIVSLLGKIASLQKNTQERPENRRITISTEARSLELWRAVAVECFATFLFSFLVLGAGGTLNNGGLIALTSAIASGVSISAIYLIFGHISGGHVNPAVSISFALSRKISPLRATLYLAAQCGGAIAAAAMLYGVNITQAMMSNPRHGTAVEKLLTEMALSILIVLAHFVANPPKTPSILLTKPAGVLAAAYTAATLNPYTFLNPARALGPAFVMNRWDSHWVYWVGPISGGALAALLNEYVLSPKRSHDSREINDGDNSSMRSDEDTYDDFDKPTSPKFPSGYATYRPVAGASSSIYSSPPTATERVESIYGGTKSLYCKSPPLTRANLNRSQSVYAKSTAAPREGFFIPKPGPLQPAQSLYQMKIGQNTIIPTRDQLSSSQGQSAPQSQSQNHNSTNQNMQNQLQQCTQSIYGIRGISTNLSTRENGIYGVTTNSSIYGRAPAPPPPPPPPPPPLSSSSASQSSTLHASQISHQQQQPNPDSGSNSRRPESMYGHVSRRSDDSAYGSYQGSNRGNYGKITGAPPHSVQSGLSQYREQSRPSPGPLQQNQAQQGNFQRNSPNLQY